MFSQGIRGLALLLVAALSWNAQCYLSCAVSQCQPSGGCHRHSAPAKSRTATCHHQLELQGPPSGPAAQFHWIAARTRSLNRSTPLPDTLLAADSLDYGSPPIASFSPSASILRI